MEQVYNNNMNPQKWVSNIFSNDWLNFLTLTERISLRFNAQFFNNKNVIFLYINNTSSASCEKF